MDYLTKPIDKAELERIKNSYSNPVKITADIDKGEIVIGCPLHADGEKILLENGSQQISIWGGGFDFNDNKINFSAVLNIRSSSDNPSPEILDPGRREKFTKVVKKILSL